MHEKIKLQLTVMFYTVFFIANVMYPICLLNCLFIFYVCLYVGLIHFISLSIFTLYQIILDLWRLLFNLINNRPNKHISLHRYKHFEMLSLI